MCSYAFCLGFLFFVLRITDYDQRNRVWDFLISFSKFFANVVEFFFLQMALKGIAEMESTEKVLSDFQVASSHILIINNENARPEIFLPYMIIHLTMQKATFCTKLFQPTRFVISQPLIKLALFYTFFHSSRTVLYHPISYKNNWKNHLKPAAVRCQNSLVRCFTEHSNSLQYHWCWKKKIQLV